MPSLSRHLRAAALLAVAAVLALGALVATPSTASAEPVRDPARTQRALYAAIAFSPDQAWGGSYNYRTKRAAKARALQECKSRSNYPRRCRVAVWVRNGCAAVAVKTDANGWVVRASGAYARSQRKAKRLALNKLSRPRKVLASVCTG